MFLTPKNNSTASDAGDTAAVPVSGARLLLRDASVFVVLALAALALYGVTAFLFRTFEVRRGELAVHFAAAAREASRQGRPEQAIQDLRTALEYSPDDRASHLLLAEALAQAHHDAEATNYFLALHEAEPADGFINLQLARLYRSRKDPAHAIESYRAASLGNWNGDGITLRLQTQLELAEYLIDLGDVGPARAELLTAAGNAPESVPFNLRIGDALRKAGAPAPALASYERALKLEPRNVAALSRAAQLAYDMGNFADASRFSELALHQFTSREAPAQLTTLARDSARLQQLSLASSLPAAERLRHLQADAAVARKRLEHCTATFAAAEIPGPLQDLKTRWQQANPTTLRASAQTVDTEQAAANLIFETERVGAQHCGAPAGDDALLLHLAGKSASQEKP